MTSALVLNASPYVTVAEAKASPGNNLHVAGTLVPGTLQSMPRQGIVKFEVQDEKGATMPVVFKGSEPGNLATTPKVVCIGQYKDGVFNASDLLVKCPSKYENTAKK